MTRWQRDADAEYRAAPGLNYSSLKVLCSQTPAHFLHALSNQREATPAMRWGSTVHSYLLDERPLTVEPSFEGKGARAARTEWLATLPPDALIVSENEKAALEAMRVALAGNVSAAYALDHGEREVSGYARGERFGLKMRADILCRGDGVIYDLKTCASAAPEKFARDAWDLSYHVQAAWYLTVANAIDSDHFHTFRWIALEKAAPYCVAVYEASADQIEAGAQAIERALTILGRCLDDGGWNGYPEDIAPLDVPRWAKPKVEEVFE
jgi:hypothetical protein